MTIQLKIKDTNKNLLISGKADFRMRNIIRDKKGHYMMTKTSIIKKKQITLNIYVTNITVSK